MKNWQECSDVSRIYSPNAAMEAAYVSHPILAAAKDFILTLSPLSFPINVYTFILLVLRAAPQTASRASGDLR